MSLALNMNINLIDRMDVFIWLDGKFVNILVNAAGVLFLGVKTVKRFEDGNRFIIISSPTIRQNYINGAMNGFVIEFLKSSSL